MVCQHGLLRGSGACLLAPPVRPKPLHAHPQGLIICPSRELANQTYEIITNYTSVLQAGGFPELRTMLCIGGIDMRSQMDLLKRGVHMVVATPGRLKDLLHKKRMNLDICRWAAPRARHACLLRCERTTVQASAGTRAYAPRRPTR